VRGLQADAAEGNYWGSIYDEKGKRGIIVNGWKDKAEKVVKANDWNEYEILCDGNHIQLKVNGLVTADIQDDSNRTGSSLSRLTPDRRCRFGSGTCASRCSSNLRAAIYGGTFDPVHEAHLAVADEARRAVSLDRVLFVPASDPPHKHGGTSAGYEDRTGWWSLPAGGATG